MRTLFLIATVTAAYAFLRGWPQEVHSVLRACFAVLGVVLGIGLWRRRDHPNCSQTRAVRPARWPDYLAVGMGILSVECLFLFFFTALPPQAEALAFRAEGIIPQARSETRASADNSRGTFGTTISGNWLWNDQGQRRLPNATEAKPSNKPEVFFRPADKATTSALLRTRPYIRSFALEVFENSTWSPHRIDAENLQSDAEGWIRFPLPAQRPGVPLRGRIYHSANAPGQNVFTALQGATQGKLPELRRIAPGILSLNPLRNPDLGYEYQTVSKPVTFDSLLEQGALPRGFELPDDVPEHLVALPENEDVRQALFDITFKTQGQLELRLREIRQLLRKKFQYTLSIKNPDERDPVLNFLLHEQAGHCEFFATAGALLCRTLDIPARVAYGWTGGRYYTQGLFMFRAREAHAWTEILLKDVGWVIFDTTPPGAIEAAGFSIAPPDEKPPLDEDGFINYDTEIDDDGDRDDELWMFMALGGGAGLVILALLVLHFRRKPTAPPGTVPSTLLPDAPGYLARFRQACLHLGTPMPSGRTLRQQLTALREAGHAPDFSDEMLNYHYAVTYGNKSPTKAYENKLVREIKRWQRPGK